VIEGAHHGWDILEGGRSREPTSRSLEDNGERISDALDGGDLLLAMSSSESDMGSGCGAHNDARAFRQRYCKRGSVSRWRWGDGQGGGRTRGGAGVGDPRCKIGGGVGDPSGGWGARWSRDRARVKGRVRGRG
jgi:hypothetical protein